MGEIMAKSIDGVCFKNMVDYAVRNLNKHVKIVNQLNVFPVPDGDTGTNMVTTIHKGLQGIEDTIIDLPSVSRVFARSVVFEARGNSGVIVSQFLKGIVEKFYDVDIVDGELFVKALESGVDYAYSSVATPVEGTMLTVIKEATEAVKREFTPLQSVDDIIDSFIKHAKVSLENTPEILAVLKENGVVDSGGAGIVYLFEGMKKYFDGETLEDVENGQHSQNGKVDYDVFDRNSRFEYGYCTELLLQLLNSKECFDYGEFKSELSALGDSLVVSNEDDKVRVHIHTHYPEKVFGLCHKYGEFLASKIENMTVQHTENTKRILCSDVKDKGAFCVVAVAYDRDIQQLFADMGADVVIYCEDNISTKDYLDAFKQCDADEILVFPNNSDAILAAIQAKKIYKKAHVTVINSSETAECYAALPTIDFEETDIHKVVDDLNAIIDGLYIVSVTRGEEDFQYAGHNIYRNDYYSFAGKELIVINKSLEEAVVSTIIKVAETQDVDVITLYYRTEISENQIEKIVNMAKAAGICADFYSVETDSLTYELTVTFES